ncbi:MAG: phytoene desaturase [Calditrichaeota bacterium]|nr:MAG: phytoene desaturase [Calditrichota bacterium]
MSQTVNVVGGGLGGLSTAIRLRNAGLKVNLFEKNSTLGGKMQEVKSQGYRFDTGPSLLTMPFVIEDLFSSVGEKMNDFLQIEPINPICKYFWEDGRTLNAFSEITQMQKEIANFSKTDSQNYPKFLDYSKRIYDLTAEIFLFQPIHEIGKVLKMKNLSTLFKLPQIDPFRTMHESIAKNFENEKIIQIFDRYATYNGSNPFKAPATLNIIPFVEYCLGGFYIRGGMYRLVDSLKEIAEKIGVKIILNSNVEKISQENKIAQGIIVNGEFVKSDFVVCNSDVVVSYNELIEGFEPKKEKLNKLEPSLSGMVFLWGVNKKTEKLSHHNIIFSNDYKQEFKDIFDTKTVSEDPTVYVSVTSKTDSNHASKDCENLFVLINAPYLTASQDWQRNTKTLRKATLQKLKSVGIDISENIEFEKTFSPKDLFNLYKSNKGSIYGISSNDRNSAFKRPPNRSRELENLYFVGGSSHPGGGIPLVLLSGKIVSELILEKQKLGFK